MKLSHTKLIVISGMIWFAVGFYLLQLGLNLLLGGVHINIAENYPLLKVASSLFDNGEIAAIVLVVIALFIGYLKGRYVLGKSAQKGVVRILTFPNPAPLSQIYSLKYYVLLVLMMGLGVSMKYIGLNDDVRGFIDAIIGSALINGAMIYFRLAQGVRAKSS
jgi:hypothetical protein